MSRVKLKLCQSSLVTETTYLSHSIFYTMHAPILTKCLTTLACSLSNQDANHAFD